MSTMMRDGAAVEGQDDVTATYREIAMRFGLGSANAARTKVKRAGWTVEPARHPADPVRIRVPREVWYQPPADIHRRNGHEHGGISDQERAFQTEHFKALDRERHRADQAEARADRAEQGWEAERARADAAVVAVDELRAQLGAAEAKIKAMDRIEAEQALRPLWRRLRDTWTPR
jgi:hypothetical protein